MTENKTPETEFRGATVEAAIAAGLERLGMKRDEVAVTIIDEGSRGLLGIGSREAVVLLSPFPASPPQIVPRPVPDAPVTSAKPDPLVDELSAAKPKPPVATKPASKPPRQVAAVAGSSDIEKDTEASFADLESERDTAVELLSELLEKMHVTAAVNGHLSEPDDLTGQQVNMIEITGDDLSALIGPRGETLDSLQYLSRLMVAHRLQRRANFVIDVEGYRQRRVQALTRLAERMADKVRQRQEPISLEPMSSYERRIIHMALREAPDVYTESTGEGKQRKVRIFPKG